MQIKEVYGENVQGMTFRHVLGQVTLITGGNGRGKTAVPKTIRLALTGALPPKPGRKDPVKEERDIYRMAGNPLEDGRMVAGVVTDSGRTSELTYTRKGAKVSLRGSVPAELAIPALMLDSRGFFALTGEAQIAAIFAACDPAQIDYSAETVRALLPPIDHKPAQSCEAAKEDIYAQIDHQFRPEVSVQRASANLIEWLKEQARANKAEAERLSGAFQAFRVDMAKMTARPTDVSAVLDEERRKLAVMQDRSVTAADGADERLAAMQREWMRLKLRLNLYAEETQLAKLRLNLYVEETQLANVVSPVAFVAAVAAKIKLLKAYLEVMKDPGEAPDIAEQVEDLECDLNGVSAKQQDTAESIAEFQALLAAAEGKLSAVGQFKLCARCAKKIVGAVEAEKETAQRALAGFVQFKAQQDARAKEIEARIRQLTEDHDKAVKAKEDFDNDQMVMKAELADFVEAHERLTQSLPEYQRLEKAVESRGQPNPELEANVTLAQASIRALEAQQSAFERYRSDMERRDTLEGQLLVAQCRAETFKAAHKEIVAAQSQATASAFAAVLQSARAFTDDILPSPLEFVDGELGRRVAERDLARDGFTGKVGDWVPYDQFSDSESRLTFIALSVALVRTAPMRIVVLDELGTFVDPHAIVQRMVQLQLRGVIDQAVMVAPGAPTWLNGLENAVKVIAL